MDRDLGRILAVDPGTKRLGLAISDPTRTLASPLEVLFHHSREEDARAILRIAAEQDATLIIIGHPLHWDGTPSRQAASAEKLAQAIQELGSIPVELVDEHGSTQGAQASRRMLGLPRKKRAGHLDDVAAAVILQGFLENDPTGEDDEQD